VRKNEWLPSYCAFRNIIFAWNYRDNILKLRIFPWKNTSIAENRSVQPFLNMFLILTACPAAALVRENHRLLVQCSKCCGLWCAEKEVRRPWWHPRSRNPDGYSRNDACVFLWSRRHAFDDLQGCLNYHHEARECPCEKKNLWEADWSHYPRCCPKDATFSLLWM